ncbi:MULTISPECIES: hypothetical protein [Rhodococcus]|uniref:Uncharacterized protein n=1 Tax=Rhodococcus opacus RKJ300 = JCM 13270 TaxID=1165867 RepID=I0WDL6_RHOOP|nr:MULTISPECIES: hypothetical protein [Rhodococcus]EID74482.1 hypothetical protein W59_29904 [Rhodococcus opacus RKJ300 = JCM 13270]QQZ18450.1 hypothetical protein GO592_40435 [Rhodococcus sp. 21391]
MPTYDIPLSEPLQKALEPLSCADLALPMPKPMKVDLPFGGSINALVDMSKGIPNDCSMNYNLMLQMAPLLAAIECPMKILKLLKPLIDIIKAVPNLDMIKIGEAMPEFIEAAKEVATCFVAFAKVPIMIMDLLKLIRSVLNCLLSQLRTVRNAMNGLALRMGEAEGRPELRSQLECAQKNLATQAEAMTSSIEPIAGVLMLVTTVASIAGMELNITLETGGAPPDSTEALDAIITVLETAVTAIDVIVGE